MNIKFLAYRTSTVVSMVEHGQKNITAGVACEQEPPNWMGSYLSSLAQGQSRFSQHQLQHPSN